MSRSSESSRKSQPFAGQAAVVTGAASGIGLALAQLLGEQGARVTLLDVREDGIAAAREELATLSADCHFAVVDVTDEQAVARFAATQSNLDILVNNAGIALNAAFADTLPEHFSRVMDVNFGGAVNTTRHLLPLLLKSQAAQLVNVASIGAYSSAPGYSSYCASKYALRGLTETLQQELQDTSINVLLVCPGSVRTGLESNSLEVLAREPRTGFTEPPGRVTASAAAEQIVAAMLRRKQRLLLGGDAKFLYACERVAPRLLNRLVARWIRKQETANA